MSCGNQSDINQTFIVEPVTSESVLSGCNGIYTNILTSCSGDTSILLGTGVIIFNGDMFTSGSIFGSTISGSSIFGDSIVGGGITGSSIFSNSIIGNGISGSSISGVSIFGEIISGGTISGGTISGDTFYGDGSNLTGIYTAFIPSVGPFSLISLQDTVNYPNIANGILSFAIGQGTRADGFASYAEGSFTNAIGDGSHAEGVNTTAFGGVSHAEGWNTTANGLASHAGGKASIAGGDFSFVHGSGSTAVGTNTVVLGANISGTNENTTYVDALNVRTLTSGSPIVNLGIDVNGHLVYGMEIIVAVDISGNTIIFTNNTGGTTTAYGLVNTATTIDINGVVQDLSENRQWVTAQGSTGVLEYDGAFMDSPTTINVGAVKGYVINNESNPLIPNTTFLDFTGETGVTVTSIGTGTGSYVLLKPDNTLLFQNTFPTSAERKENILLSKVGHPNGTVTFVINEPDFVLSPISQLRDLFKSIKYINDGVFAYPNPGNNLQFNITGGFIFGNGVNFVVDDENPNQVAVGPFSSGTSFVYRTQTGGTSGLVTSITPNFYDLNGVITPAPTTASTIQWIFDVPSAGFAVQYGQTLYSNLNDAVIAVGKETFTVFPNLIENAILIGVLAVTSTASTLTATTQAKFFRADKFGQIAGSQAGTSTSTLQNAYDNSSQPQITITPNNGALQIKSFNSSAGILQGLNTAGTPTFNVDGFGNLSATTLHGATGGTIGLVVGVQGLTPAPGTFPIAEFNDQTGFFSDWNFRVAGGGSPIVNFMQSTGTLQAPNVSNNNGNYGQIVSWGYNTGYSQTAVISFAKDGVPSTASTPSKITFTTTPVGSRIQQERFSINNQGQLTINATPSAGTSNDNFLVRTNAGNVRQVPFSAVSITISGVSATTISAATIAAVNAIFANGVTASTVSATTYYNLPLDISITGGTYTAGTTTLTNNTGGTVIITGYTYIPHLEYDNTNKTIWNNGFSNVIDNTSFGDSALVSITTGNESAAFGYQSLSGNTSGDFNSAFGAYSLTNNRSGNNNTGIGDGALYSNIAGSFNTFVGAGGGQNLTGSSNTGVGAGVMLNVTSGVRNTAMGDSSLGGSAGNVTGSFNIAIGFKAGNAVTSGSRNLILTNTTGNTVGGVTTGNNNIILDPVEKTGIQTGSNNTIIGGFNNTISDFSDQVIIGTGNGIRRLEFNSVGQTRIVTTPSAGTNTDSILVRNDITGFIGVINPNSITFSGGIVTGAAYFSNGLSANTISATTYLGLPIDVYVTGGTFSGSTAIFVNNTGGTFFVTGFSSAASFTGGTVTGGTYFSGGLSANTFSATTYLGLPPDIRVTGGTLSGNTAIFTNSTGGTFNVNGIVNTATTLNINGNLYDLNANREWVLAQGSTGVLTYAGAFMHSSTTINVGAVKGYIVDNETNPLVPSFIYLDFTGQTGVTVTTIGGGTGSYVLLTTANTITFQNTFPTSAERKENILLSKVGHPSGTVTFVINEPDFILSPVSQLRDLFKSIKYINDGVFAYPNTGLTFNITGGFVFGNGVNFVTDDENPNQVAVGPFTSGTSFVYRTQTGGTAGLVSGITPSFYDVGGVITPVPTSASTIQWIFNVPSAGFAVQYGQTLYPSLTEAISNVGKEDFTVFPNLVENAILIGVLAVIATATTLSATSQARFFRADKFGQIVGSQAGVSTATLQSAYDNSTQPQITIGASGALQVKSTTPNTVVFQTLNQANTVGVNMNGGGAMTAGTVTAGSVNATTISATTYLNLPTSSSATFTGGTVSGPTIFTSGLTATTFNVQNITAGEALVYGNLVYLSNDGRYYKASNLTASTSSTELRLVLASIASGGTGNSLVNGQFTTTGLTAGARYIIGTGGTITTTQPSTDYSIVRYVGTALSTTKLEFNSDETYIELINFTGSTGGSSSGFSGGTVNGQTLFTNGLSANTFSATTYLNLPSFTGGTVSGATNFINGLSANTISATTYLNIPSATFSGGTVTGPTNFIAGLTANTISATTITSPSLALTAGSATNSWVVRGSSVTTAATNSFIFKTGVVGTTPNLVQVPNLRIHNISAGPATPNLPLALNSVGEVCFTQAVIFANYTEANGLFTFYDGTSTPISTLDNRNFRADINANVIDVKYDNTGLGISIDFNSTGHYIIRGSFNNFTIAGNRPLVTLVGNNGSSNDADSQVVIAVDYILNDGTIPFFVKQYAGGPTNFYGVIKIEL